MSFRLRLADIGAVIQGEVIQDGRGLYQPHNTLYSVGVFAAAVNSSSIVLVTIRQRS